MQVAQLAQRFGDPAPVTLLLVWVKSLLTGMKRRFDLAVHFPSQTELPPSLRRAFRFASAECPPGGVVHLGGFGVMPCRCRTRPSCMLLVAKVALLVLGPACASAVS